MTLSTLRTRLETATEADQAEVLEMAFDVLCPHPGIVWKDSQRTEWADSYAYWQGLGVKAGNMIDAKAYTDAALLIMREVLPGWHIFLLTEDRHSGSIGLQLKCGASRASGRGLLMSIAIIAAVCAAKGDSDA